MSAVQQEDRKPSSSAAPVLCDLSAPPLPEPLPPLFPLTCDGWHARHGARVEEVHGQGAAPQAQGQRYHATRP
eukprot:3940570-Rhodomonas_salina.3